MACELIAPSSKLTRVKECGVSPEHAVQSSKKLPWELGNTRLGVCSWFGTRYKLISLCIVQEKINEVIVSLNSISVSINCWVKLPVIVSFCAC